MIAVAAEFRAPVLFVPVVEQQVIIVLRLAAFPAVERFVHHHHAQAVAQIEQFRRGRIVAGADGVAAHFLQDLNLPLQRAGVDGRAERAEVVMVANAVERHALAVQQKSVVRRELDGADAERRFVAVHQFAVLFDGGDGDIALRFLDAPQVSDCAMTIWPSVRLGLVRGDFHAVGGERRDGFAPGAVRVEFENFIFHRHGGVGVRVIVHVDLDIHRRRLGADLRRGDISAPVRDVDRRGFDQPDVAVNAAARIPARGIRRIVEADGDDVVRAEFDERRQVHAPRGVAIGPAADELAVEPDRRVGHRAVHVQIDFFALVGRRERPDVCDTSRRPTTAACRFRRDIPA